MAQTNAPPQVRTLSLQDCIHMALQHNLDLQIDRNNPVLSLYALRGDYGVYEPTFFLSGQQQHNEAGSSFWPAASPSPGQQSDDTSFNSSLGGQTPWGMTYNLQGNISDTTGKSFGLDPNGALVTNPFGRAQVQRRSTWSSRC